MKQLKRDDVVYFEIDRPNGKKETITDYITKATEVGKKTVYRTFNYDIIAKRVELNEEQCDVYLCIENEDGTIRRFKRTI